MLEPRDKSHGFSLTKDYYHGAEEEQAYIGEDKEWMDSPHNPMMDENGRVWMTEQIRAGGQGLLSSLGQGHDRPGRRGDQ